MFDKKKLKDKNSILAREYDKNFEKKTMLGIEIALQKELDPKEISAKKPTSGRSWEDITRAEHIEILENELEQVELLLSTIESQFE